MPKGDSLCPLGFHPQFRRPNYCKRCFREYNEHKQSGSNTSINSLSIDRDSRKDEDGTNRSRSDLTSALNSKSNYHDVDKKGYSRGSYPRGRPMSWSAQDLSRAVDDAKEQTKSSRGDPERVYAYGGHRSMTQDLGTLSKLTNVPELSTNTKKYSKEAEDEPKSSFSSYLATKYKPNVSSSTPKTTSIPTESTLESSKYTPLGKPPKGPVRSKTELDFRDAVETVTLSRPRKSISSLREVKSEDGDASYIIHLTPKKGDSTQKDSPKLSDDDRLHEEATKLKDEIKQLTDKNAQLERDNKEFMAKKSKFGEFRKSSENSKLQLTIDKLNEEIKTKNREVREMKKELEKRPLSKDIEKTLEELRSKLHTAEHLCEELVEENEENKKEMGTLENEIEELQDNFREDQADEYRDLKRDLEQKAKDCRVLQFKLKKAERRTDQLERDKDEVDLKLKDLQVGESDLERAERIQLLEKEASLAREVSMKMHEEMEKMKSQLEVAETDKRKLKEKVQETPMRPTGKYSRANMLGRQGSQENPDQTLSDLQDALEREQDIKEQLKYSEEETGSLRKKLSRFEDENETLQAQLSKMSIKAKRQRSMERTGSSERSNSVERGSLSRQGSTEKPQPLHLKITTGDDLDPTDLKIQLELNEQEVVILRRKVESLESDNLRLQKDLRDFLCNLENKKAQTIPSGDSSKSSALLNNKIRTLEHDLQDQKKKISEIERERDQLNTDLNAARKRARITRNRSLEQAEAEEKKKMDTFEKEISALRQKCIELEYTNEKLHDEVKRQQLKISYKKPPFSTQDNLGIENKVLSEKIKRLEKKMQDISGSAAIDQSVKGEIIVNNVDHSNKIKELQDIIDGLQNEIGKIKKDNEEMKNSSSYKDRKVKTPKETTPRNTLIKWVNELENECAALYATLQAQDKKVVIKDTDASSSQRDIMDKLQKEKERNEELSRQLQEERKKSEKNHLKSRTSGTKEDEEKMKKLQRDLDTEKTSMAELQKQISEGTLINFEQLRQAQTEKHKLQKELTSFQQAASTLERKLKETEETLKISEKAERNLRNLLDKAEQRLDEERNAQYTMEERQKEVSVSWLKERDDLKKEILEIKRSKESLEREIKQVHKNVKSTEERLLLEKKAFEDSEGKLKSDKERQQKLYTENETLKLEYSDLRDTINSIEKEKDRSIRKYIKEMDGHKKENEDLKIRMTTLEMEIKTEKKKRERIEKDSSIGLRGKTSEIQEYKEKLLKLDNEKGNLAVEINTLKTDCNCQINDLNKQLKDKNKEIRDFRNTIMTYEEEIEHQNTQLQLSQDKTFTELKKDYETIERELKTLRETYNLHKDTWIKEKLTMQVHIIEIEDRYRRNGDGSSYSEREKLMSIIEDKQQQIDTCKLEIDTVTDQLSCYRKETDEYRKKIEDLEKLQDICEKRQSSTAADNRGYETTIRDLKTRLTSLEKTGRGEITKMKMRYDTKIKALTEEVSTLTHHMTKYRRERDTYKEMLNGTQKTIAELKGNTNISYRTSRADNASEIAAVDKRLSDYQAKAHLNEILDLQSQITDLEDKLADSRMEVTKLKNEAVDQKTSYEIQLSDLQTKLNEHEEDRLISGSGRKVVGLRTRLELNWQREREEQQRLIQETSTLAKDLRQTLYEVERERDMERLDAKRKIDQLKKTVSMEHQDTKGKVLELQTDIRDLREAHAKLRQINEKLRKDKDRTSLEREAMRDKFLGSSREHLNQQAKLEKLMEHVYKVKDLSPLVIGESIDEAGTSLKNLAIDNNPKTKEQFTTALKELAKHSEDLKILMGLGDELDRMRRTPSFRKALSVESDDGSSYTAGGGYNSSAHRQMSRPYRSQLYRKAQSLDHQLADEKGKIWVGEAGSTSSIESARTEDMKTSGYTFDGSLDRMSTGSQTSDLDLAAEKKKGIRGMLSKFGKSKSIEDTNTAGTIVSVGVKALAHGMTSSGNIIGSEEQDPSVKDKIKTFFKKSSTSRSQSSERDNLNSKRSPNQYEDSAKISSANNQRAPRSVRR